MTDRPTLEDAPLLPKGPNRAPWMWRTLGPLAALVATLPLLLSGQLSYNNPDWRLGVALHEVVIKSLLEFGELPHWSPYIEGGYPVGAHPEVPFPSLGLIAPLILGVDFGMKINVAILFVVGVTGLYALGRRLGLGGPPAAFAAVCWAAGHWLPGRLAEGNYYETFVFLWPWLPVCLLRALGPKGRFWIIAGSALVALWINNGGLTLPPALLFGVGLAVLAAWNRDGRRGAAAVVVAAGLVSAGGAALAAPKLLPMLRLLSERPRKVAPDALERVDLEMGRALSFPLEDCPRSAASTGAVAAYWGLPLVALVGVFAAPRARLVGGLWLAAVGWAGRPPLAFDPFSLLQPLPLFGSMREPGKYFGIYPELFLCIAAGAGFALLAGRWQSRRARWLLAVLLVAVCVGPRLNCHWTHPSTYFVYPPSELAASEEGFFHVSGPGVGLYERPPQAIAANNVMRGIGTIEARAELVLHRSALPRYFVDREGGLETNPKYRGEAFLSAQSDGSARLASLTSNTVAVHVDLARAPSVLHVNQNHHPGWHSDAGPVFSEQGLLSVRLTRPGSYEVRWWYEEPRFAWGIGIMLLAAAALLTPAPSRAVARALGGPTAA